MRTQEEIEQYALEATIRAQQCKDAGLDSAHWVWSGIVAGLEWALNRDAEVGL